MKTALKSAALAATLAVSAPASVLAEDFNGLYIGAYGAYAFTGPTGAGVGGNIGYLFSATPRINAGIELDGTYFYGGTIMAQGALRLGYELSDDFMLGAKVGAGFATTAGSFYTLGATADYDFGSGFGVRAGYEHLRCFTGCTPGNIAKAGLSYNF